MVSTINNNEEKMIQKLDVVLINPGDKKQVYQDLGNDYSAVEPPFWSAALAANLRNHEISVMIIDSNAENLSPEETAQKVVDLNPLLAAVIVYGSQPSASTQNMTIAGKICKAIRNVLPIKIALGGLHPTALPTQTLQDESVDFVIAGEGHITLRELCVRLRSNASDFSNVPGLWYYDQNGKISSAPLAEITSDISSILPVAAWDLLPMQKYKAHNWHCFDHIDQRMPYAAIYTSLGCPYNCIFCCINALFGKSGIRYRKPEIVLDEIDLLVTRYNVKNIKIIDELFVLDVRHYIKIVDMLNERNYGLNFWAYARVDTVNTVQLEKMKKAGINWLALGIESANPEVRDKATKRMHVKDIKQVVRQIQDAGIRVIGNYIFGLPEDTVDTMQQTLDLAIDLNCEFANFYCAMAYPGSKLYQIAVEQKWELPDSWHGFSQHGYEMMPLPTNYISAKDVLQFRDKAFHSYFENPKYLSMLNSVFGKGVEQHVQDMVKTRLRRKLLGN